MYIYIYIYICIYIYIYINIYIYIHTYVCHDLSTCVNRTITKTKASSVTSALCMTLFFFQQMVALAGASGCGKSTVAALLTRLYEPTSGDLFLDGV